MPEFSETTKNVRKYLLDTIIATGSAPNVGMIMGELNLPKSSAMDSLKELERGVAIVMEPYTENIRMVHPLANISTPYQVTVDGEKKWWGE